MGNNAHYWTKRDEKSAQAKKHYEEMEAVYGNDIDACVKASRIYGGPAPMPKPAGNQGKKTVSTVMMTTTDGALAACGGENNIALLNFASYKNPGGMFLEGSMAQEEALCHVSTLYNVLEKIPSYYKWNAGELNKGMYTDRAIYTPGVYFTNCLKTANVITCAAPNRSVLVQYKSFTEEENLAALTSRVQFVRDICVENGVETVILGAWGCGVFSQDPATVAKLFMTMFAGTGIHCIYAIPGEETYNIFKGIISE